MLYLLLGPDSFTKREYVKNLAGQARVEAEYFYGDGELPPLERFAEQDLFSAARVFAVERGMDKYEFSEKGITALAGSKNQIIFLEDKLDKRSARSKKLLENKDIKIKNFPLPHGRELDVWITKRVQQLGGEITPKAVDLLAKRLGRDEAKETKIAGKIVEAKEIFDLWQADSEIKKLLALAGKQPIQETDVENLSPINESSDVFLIINAIGEGKKQLAISLVQKFLDEESGDDKAKVIQLNALLSDQFRSICMAQDFLAKRIPENEILEKTSWKPGRLFVMKKIAAKFDPRKVKETLNKLEALDEELKTSSTPPKVLLGLILAQMF